jgi:hypothetical protein
MQLIQTSNVDYKQQQQSITGTQNMLRLYTYRPHWSTKRLMLHDCVLATSTTVSSNAYARIVFSGLAEKTVLTFLTAPPATPCGRCPPSTTSRRQTRRPRLGTTTSSSISPSRALTRRHLLRDFLSSSSSSTTRASTASQTRSASTALLTRPAPVDRSTLPRRTIMDRNHFIHSSRAFSLAWPVQNVAPLKRWWAAPRPSALS